MSTSAAELAFAYTPGTCAVSGSESFTPTLGLIPADQSVNITLSGTTCVTLAGTNTVSLTLSGGFLMSCAGGVGSVAGQVLFASNPPPGGAVTAVDLMLPGAMALAVMGAGFEGFVIAATVGCPVNNSTASALGTFVFNSA